ncbi:sensor histidine kinase [Pseudonocardia sp. CA-107938]|uniref:sensor histidine kinase n=1 Tax=Pseudonocardia sp. CA-107938 TaxID=3240021 RepID=UPI003D941BCA
MSRSYRDLLVFVRSPAGDAAVLGAVAVAVFAGTPLLAAHDPAARPLWPGGAGLLAVAVGVLMWRRQRPVVALTITAAAAVAYYLLGYPAGFEPLPFVVALYGASRHGHRIVALAAAVLAAVLIGAVQLAAEPRVDPGEVMVVLGWLLVVIVLGEVVRSRQLYVEQVEARAADAERSRESEAVRRVVEERLRIARELHDALAHHIAVISVQAGAAILHRDDRPAMAHEMMPTIKEAAAAAMRELRATVGVLRHPTDDPALLAPPPGLDRLAELLTAGGPAVSIDVVGARRPLPADVDVAAYRIVQEALTNAGRHGQPSAVSVRLRYLPDELEIVVDNDGPVVAEPVAGNGLVGMRERAAAVGGTVVAGPRTGGGFTVRATLPAGSAG